jgi:heme-degrading monooxygenase HmoA
MTARVMVFATVDPSDAEAFEAAFALVRQSVAGTPGHLGDQLLKDDGAPGRYILLSKWRTIEQFRAWEDAPVHRQMTTPLRPYWSGAIERRIFEVVVPGDDRSDLEVVLAGEVTGR